MVVVIVVSIEVVVVVVVVEPSPGSSRLKSVLWRIPLSNGCKVAANMQVAEA